MKLQPWLLSAMLPLVAIAAPITSNLTVSSDPAARKAVWQEKSIYQIVTDRFALSDGSSPDCNLGSYCGGTWKGIENKLDYIAGMGFDAIWISPISHNIEDNTKYGNAYHGYWQDDPTQINEHFGTSSDLMDLSEALHERGMLLMVDFVINHFALNQDPNKGVLDFSHLPKPYNTADAFHPRCGINYNDQTSVEDCWLVASDPPLLADVNTENSNVFDDLVSSVAKLVKDYNIDGIRLDTARHVPKKALQQFQDAVGVFVTGEVLQGNVNFVAPYQGPMDSLLNYPLYFKVNDTFAAGASFEPLADTLGSEQSQFSDASVLGNFIDNHDQSRFASLVGPDGAVLDMNAAALIMMAPGLPIVYYGFEQRLAGLNDPDNRGPLWPAQYNMNPPLYQHIAKLNKIRALAKADTGVPLFANSPANVIQANDTSIVFQRESLLVVINNSGPDGVNGKTEVLSQTTYAEGNQLMDVLDCASTVTVGANGSFPVSISGMPQIWAPKDFASGVCSAPGRRALKL